MYEWMDFLGGEASSGLHSNNQPLTRSQNSLSPLLNYIPINPNMHSDPKKTSKPVYHICQIFPHRQGNRSAAVLIGSQGSHLKRFGRILCFCSV